MRLAIAGKGGAGKTTISATLARLEARAGREVVAIDADSNPNLSTALGVAVDPATTATFLPFRLVSRRPEGPRLNLAVEEVLNRYAVPAPDGVRLSVMGMPDHADTGCLCSAHATVSALLSDLGERDDIVTIIDLEGTPEHLSRGTARHADVLLLVAEPYFRSLETVRRLATLASELPIPCVAVVANKIRSDTDLEVTQEFCARHGLEVLGAVPWDTSVTDADSMRTPLIELAPDGPVVAAVSALAEQVHRAARAALALSTPGAH